jgi:hypothetical protein
MSKSKDIGNAGERNHRQILSSVWPDIKRKDDRYHPTQDHDNTGPFHVESKKRATWNIKDVVKAQIDGTPHDQWIIAYEDRNRTKRENPSIPVAILPLTELAIILQYARRGGYNV